MAFSGTCKADSEAHGSAHTEWQITSFSRDAKCACPDGSCGTARCVW